MNRFLKIAFVLLVIRPVVLIMLGLTVRNRENLPRIGPAIIAANHNSHLDTMIMFYLYPLSKVHKLRPVAAADYFLANPIVAWFSTKVIGIIPLPRSGFNKDQNIFEECERALDDEDILILFPEGTRGQPEQVSRLKKGIYRLAVSRPDVKVVPLVTYGLGRSLPKGEALFVPFNCDVVVGEPIDFFASSTEFMASLSWRFDELLKMCSTRMKKRD